MQAKEVGTSAESARKVRGHALFREATRKHSPKDVVVGIEEIRKEGVEERETEDGVGW